jgi:protein phosphatase
VKVSIPELSLVVLIGTSGSGKSTFARRHFKPTEVLSSDYFRGLVSDDENDQTISTPAFETLHFVAAKRLQLGRLVVVDATNVQPDARKPLVELARRHHVIPVAIVIDVPERLAHERNQTRADRDFGPHVIRQQHSQLRRSLRNLQREGFRHVHVLRSVAEVDSAEVVREPLWNNRRWDHGPFDIIGDVHGCADELEDLLEQLGYVVPDAAVVEGTTPARRHPGGSSSRVRRRPRGSRAAHSRRAHDGDELGGDGRRVMRAGEPRHQADAQASGSRCADYARIGGLHRPARRRAAGVS